MKKLVHGLLEEVPGAAGGRGWRFVDAEEAGKNRIAPRLIPLCDCPVIEA